MKAQTISIIGLGRTGASVGLALKASHLNVTVIGHDKDGDAAKAAQEAGAIDSRQWRLVRAAAEGDIIILAVPDSEVEGILEAIGQDIREHALILSFSSLKGAGQRWADRYLQTGHYVGAVPVLAASALQDGTPGVAGARVDLFRDSILCLMPSPRTDPQAVETAVNLGTVLGAKPFFLDADEYDNLVLGVETIPGLLAAALFAAITEANGWRDMLRFANLPFATTGRLPCAHSTTRPRLCAGWRK
jgi:prephenate dehydrogenase